MVSTPLRVMSIELESNSRDRMRTARLSEDLFDLAV